MCAKKRNFTTKIATRFGKRLYIFDYEQRGEFSTHMNTSPKYFFLQKFQKVIFGHFRAILNFLISVKNGGDFGSEFALSAHVVCVWNN